MRFSSPNRSCCRVGRVRNSFRCSVIRTPGVGWWRPAENRTVFLVMAPITQLRWTGAEIACLTCGLDGTPDRHQRLLESQQLVMIRRVIQQLAVSQVDEPQPRRQ